MGKQPGIILYQAEYKSVRNVLSKEQKGELLDALMEFGDTGEMYIGDDPLVCIAFNIFSEKIRINEERYTTRCEKNSENIKKRWERNKQDTNVYERIRTDTTTYEPPETKTETKTEAKTEAKTKNNNIFNPPTVEEVESYCKEQQYTIDPNEFFDYNMQRGWILKDGRKMKDWKASVRTWERNKRKWSANELRGAGNSDRVIGQRDLYGL